MMHMRPGATSVSAASGVAAARPRLDSIDMLRGLVILIMALDHVREFLSLVKGFDTSTMTPAYFFTRWITHFCAPAFVFLAGTSASLSMSGGRRTPRQLSGFLVTRGLWLVLMEWTIIDFGFFFNTTYTTSFGWVIQVIWVLGVSMIVLAGLVRLPMWVSVVMGGAMVAGHNLLDGVEPASFGAWAPLWNILHVSGTVMVGSQKLFVLYPLIPWVGVMALGYAFGALLTRQRPAAERQRLLLSIGAVLTIAFVVIRVLNGYGEPKPWVASGNALGTIVSFLDATKYPPSLVYLLMTLGPSIAMLAWMERWKGSAVHVLTTFGRVPFFFYIVHVYVIHTATVAAGWLQGFPVSAMLDFCLFLPKEFGFSLPVVYLLWAGLVLLMYPTCRWFASVKANHRHPLLSYL
jgi:uncharacterized membrane protein